MTTNSIFQNEEAKRNIRRWHGLFLEPFESRVESRTVRTRFGETHLLVGGPEEAPPLVILHAALASSSHLLGELLVLLDRFRVYAVDIPGQSVMSEDVRISVANNDYGVWLGEVLDRQGLDRVYLLGVSWGGFVSLRFTALAPDRVKKLALLVPAGMVNGPALKGLFRVALPMVKFRRNPDETNLRKFMKNLITTVDGPWLDYLREAFLGYRLDMRIPSLARVGEFDGFQAPVLVMGAQHDLSFPGAKIVKRAKRLFRGPLSTFVIPGARHSPPTTEEFRQWMGTRLTEFFGDDLSHT